MMDRGKEIEAAQKQKENFPVKLSLASHTEYKDKS